MKIEIKMFDIGSDGTLGEWACKMWSYIKNLFKSINEKCKNHGNNKE